MFKFHGSGSPYGWRGRGRHGFGGRGGSAWDDRHEAHGHGGGGHGRRAGMRRLFAHGDLHLIVLRLIAEKPRHGYELIKSIEAAVGGAYSPSPGTIYPALTLLEEQGWIEAVGSEGAKKLFAVTEAGRAHLEANRATIEAMLARMAEASAQRSQAPAQVVRAMENLKFALRLRLEKGGLSDDAARAIAEALDRAVADIEKT